jgi:Peptidogalycan biosysnthesis/recognition
LTPQLTTTLYTNTHQLPSDWDTLAAKNIFLTSDYLKILELSAPANINCHYIGIFKKQKLVGVALSQFIGLKKLSKFGDRDQCVKTYIRDIAFRNLASNVLLIGNTMLTGQNAFVLSEEIDSCYALELLQVAALELKTYYKSIGKSTNIICYKDFAEEETISLSNAVNSIYYKFETQPNMVFEIKNQWNNEVDYVAALSKKYRDQYKRARKKAIGIEKRKLSLQEIINQEDSIYNLYYHVAQNAPFNTFYLCKNHFAIFKEIMNDKFLFYGYYMEDKMVGFNTLIKNGTVMETYFLGYNDDVQKDKLLYLNMLYDMIGYSIKKGFNKIIFARTALEIKSSVGAQPQSMFGFIRHENKLLNYGMESLFKYLEPKTVWNKRNPYK